MGEFLLGINNVLTMWYVKSGQFVSDCSFWHYLFRRPKTHPVQQPQLWNPGMDTGTAALGSAGVPIPGRVQGGCGIWGHGWGVALALLGEWLVSMSLEGSSNLNDSGILLFQTQEEWNKFDFKEQFEVLTLSPPKISHSLVLFIQLFSIRLNCTYQGAVKIKNVLTFGWWEIYMNKISKP